MMHGRPVNKTSAVGQMLSCECSNWSESTGPGGKGRIAIWPFEEAGHVSTSKGLLETNGSVAGGYGIVVVCPVAVQTFTLKKA